MLAWCAVAATVLTTVMAVRRKLAWDDLDLGDVGFEGVVRVDDADDLFEAARFVAAALALATLIVVSIWSLRVARRARLQGATDVSSGLACGGWYIPYAAAIVPFVQLRRMARHWRRHPGAVNMWQAFTIASWVIATGVQGLEPGDDDSFDDITSMLTAQLFGFVLLVLALAAAAYGLHEPCAPSTDQLLAARRDKALPPQCRCDGGHSGLWWAVSGRATCTRRPRCPRDRPAPTTTGRGRR